MTIDKNSAHITNGGAPSVNASFNAGFKVSGPEPLDSRVYVVSKELMLAWPDTLGKPYFGMSVLVLFNDTDAATGAHIWNSTTGEINRNLLIEANLRLERFVLLDPTNIHNDTAWTNEVGSIGSQGAQGAQGAQGPAGTNGTNGSNGADGSQGAQGAQGPAGTNGTNGSNGADGSQGAQGAQGPAGTNGTNGSNGADGSQGAQGAQGPAGTNGTNGSNGADGSQGAQGAQGPAGTNGTNGSNGADGNCIWTTTNAPTTPNYTFTISNLSGPTGATPQVGDIILHSYYRYTISSVSSTTVRCTGRVSIRGADGAQGAQGTPGSTGNNGYGVYFTNEYHDEQTTTEDSVSFTYSEIVIANQDVKLKKGDLIVCKTGWVYMIDTFTVDTLNVKGHYVAKWIGATGDNGAQGAQGPAGTNGTTGAAGKGMFRTSQSVTSTSTTANAVTFTYANITRNGRTLQVGDFILAPNGNLYMLDTGGSTPKGHYLYNIKGPAGDNGTTGERGYTLLYYREHLEDGWTLDENKFEYLSSTGDFKKSDFVIDPDGNLGYVSEGDIFIYLTTIGGGSSSTHVFISNDAYIDGAHIDPNSLPDPLGFGLNEGDTIISPEGKVGHARYDSENEGYSWSYIGDLPSTGGGGSGSQGTQGTQGTQGAQGADGANGSNGLCMFTTTQNLTGKTTSANAYTFTYNSIVRANRTIQVGDKIVSLPASNPSCNVYIVDSVSGTTVKGHYVSCLKGAQGAQGAGGSGSSISGNTLDLTFYKYDGTTNVTHTFYVQ